MYRTMLVQLNVHLDLTLPLTPREKCAVKSQVIHPIIFAITINKECEK